MKILLIHNFYQQFGGADWVALQEKKYLERTDEVFLYSRHNHELRQFSVAQKVRSAIDTMYCRSTASQVREIVRTFAPDFAYVFNVYPLISPSVFHVLHELQVPILHALHDFRPACPNGLFFTQGRPCERCSQGSCFNAVVHRCYRASYGLSAVLAAAVGLYRTMGGVNKVDAYLCLSEFSKQRFMAAGIPEHKIFIRPNYIDGSEVVPNTNVGSYVGYLGRLAPEKGLWTLVRAFEQLKNPLLKVAGTGPLEADLKKYVAERAINNIEFVGFKSGEEKWNFLKNSAFIVVSSECYEQFPISILEAFTAGKPVLASNYGAFPYIIHPGKDGMLFRPGDHFDLAEQVDRLFRDPSLIETMGKYARNLVDTKYNPQYSRDLLVDIFCRATGRSAIRTSDPVIEARYAA